MNAFQQFLHDHHGKIISVLGTLLMGVSYVASGNVKVESFLADHGLYTKKNVSEVCKCGCGCANCKCGKPAVAPVKVSK